MSDKYFNIQLLPYELKCNIISKIDDLNTIDNLWKLGDKYQKLISCSIKKIRSKYSEKVLVEVDQIIKLKNLRKIEGIIIKIKSVGDLEKLQTLKYLNTFYIDLSDTGLWNKTAEIMESYVYSKFKLKKFGHVDTVGASLIYDGYDISINYYLFEDAKKLIKYFPVNNIYVSEMAYLFAPDENLSKYNIIIHNLEPNIINEYFKIIIVKKLSEAVNNIFNDNIECDINNISIKEGINRSIEMIQKGAISTKVLSLLMGFMIELKIDITKINEYPYHKPVDMFDIIYVYSPSIISTLNNYANMFDKKKVF